MKMKDLMQAFSLGIEIAVPVFLCAFLGYFFDRTFNTLPWGMVAGVLIGAIAGFWNVYKFAVKQ